MINSDQTFKSHNIDLEVQYKKISTAASRLQTHQ